MHFRTPVGSGRHFDADEQWEECPLERNAGLAHQCLVALRVVKLGSVSGDEIRLPGAVLRGSAIQLMGSAVRGRGGVASRWSRTVLVMR